MATAVAQAAAARAARAERDAAVKRLDFDRAPFTIAWELTRACAYACLHCRADAQPRRDPLELSTSEGEALIDQLATFGNRPILVLTGGDPLMRRDIFELASHADRQGLRVSLTPTATALTTRKRMAAAREAGIRRVAFSVDAADPRVHDRFRGFKGSFERTLRGIENAAAEGLGVVLESELLADIELARGSLVAPFAPEFSVVTTSYYLVRSDSGRNGAATSKFVRWLRQAIGDGRPGAKP